MLKRPLTAWFQSNMSGLDTLLSMVRARNVFKSIASGRRYRMPCGDSRLVARMHMFGAVRLVYPKDREITTSWVLTDLGLSKLELISGI